MATPRGPILTQADRELLNAPRGAELAQGVAQRMRDRAPMAMAPTLLEPATAGQMTWGDFQQRHPEWCGDYWAECRALYAGGSRLLADKAVLERLFPSHRHENQQVYEERKKRAHYYPYAGTIIDNLLSGLGTDPLRITFAEQDVKTGASELPPEAEWWERWVQDVCDLAERPSDYGLEDDDDGEDDDEGGVTMHAFIVDVLREALQTRTAWVLADLPEVDDSEEKPVVDSKLAAEQNALDPYLCVVPAEQVIDWQTDRTGRHLEWAIIMTQEQIRATPKDRRGKIRHTYVLWDAVAWTKYEIDVDPGNLPHAETIVPEVASAAHGFGRVPLERLVLPEGLHAMGKLHSLAREHFNKRCAMSWAEYKSLFAVLYEFLGAEDNNGMPTPTNQIDSARATNQIRGQGYTQVRGKDDDARYVGPDVAPFKEARESCNDAMREMHRVMFSMALSADMNNKALNRSGESKQEDNVVTAVLLDAFGTIVRRFFRRLLVLAALGRGEAPPKCRVEGLEQFDVSGTAQAITEAVEMFNGIPILSPTFRELALARIYAKYLGDAITPEQMVEIRQEIRDAISAEETAIAGGLIPGVAPGGPAPKPTDKPQLPEPDPDEDDADKAPVKPGYSSKRKPKR